MVAISNAVGPNRVSRVVGYSLSAGVFREDTPNLPQRIALFGPANMANAGQFSESPKVITSAAQVGSIYGYGSPLHVMSRIMLPQSGDGVGGIPIVVYPQVNPGGAIQRIASITVVTAGVTANADHEVIINGRDNVDGQRYNFIVAIADTADAVALKIVASINAVVGSPVIAAIDGVNSNQVNLTVKFAGVIGNDLDIAVSAVNTAGITYTIAEETAGVGEFDISTALDSFGQEWNTIVINPYGESSFDALEIANGIPDADNPTGRYSATIFKPFIALYGSTTDDPDAVITITDDADRKSQVTNVHCPAPASKGWPFEAAANVAALLAVVNETRPHTDVSGSSYLDMPVPSDGVIGDMSNYNVRDLLVKSGSSTVDLINNVYQIFDLVTTYHPDGILNPAFRFVRNLTIDWNFAFGYKILTDLYVVGKAIAESDQVVIVGNVIKPKMWRQVLNQYADDMAQRALISDPQFMKDRLNVGAFPDRFETKVEYKRSAFSRVVSTDAVAGFISSVN